MSVLVDRSRSGYFEEMIIIMKLIATARYKTEVDTSKLCLLVFVDESWKITAIYWIIFIYSVAATLTRYKD